MMIGLSLVPIVSYFPRFAGGFLAPVFINNPQRGQGKVLARSEWEMTALHIILLISPGSPGRFYSLRRGIVPPRYLS